MTPRREFVAGSRHERLDTYGVRVPEGTIQDWRVRRVELDEGGAAALTAKNPTRPVLPGIYTRLTHQGQEIQTTYPTRVRDHYRLLSRVHGHVLMAGLGLGVVARQVLLLPEVVQLTVIEDAWEVIRLVKPALRAEFGDRLRIVHADVTKTVVPRLDGRPWDTVWYDIWPVRPKVHDVYVISWLIRRTRRRLLAPPVWQGAPGRYELIAEYKRLREAWRTKPVDWGSILG